MQQTFTYSKQEKYARMQDALEAVEAIDRILSKRREGKSPDGAFYLIGQNEYAEYRAAVRQVEFILDEFPDDIRYPLSEGVKRKMNTAVSTVTGHDGRQYGIHFQRDNSVVISAARSLRQKIKAYAATIEPRKVEEPVDVVMPNTSPAALDEGQNGQPAQTSETASSVSMLPDWERHHTFDEVAAQIRTEFGALSPMILEAMYLADASMAIRSETFSADGRLTHRGKASRGDRIFHYDPESKTITMQYQGEDEKKHHMPPMDVVDICIDPRQHNITVLAAYGDTVQEIHDNIMKEGHAHDVQPPQGTYMPDGAGSLGVYYYRPSTRDISQINDLIATKVEARFKPFHEVNQHSISSGAWVMEPASFYSHEDSEFAAYTNAAVSVFINEHFPISSGQEAATFSVACNTGLSESPRTYILTVDGVEVAQVKYHIHMQVERGSERPGDFSIEFTGESLSMLDYSGLMEETGIRTISPGDAIYCDAGGAQPHYTHYTKEALEKEVVTSKADSEWLLQGEENDFSRVAVQNASSFINSEASEANDLIVYASLIHDEARHVYSVNGSNVLIFDHAPDGSLISFTVLDPELVNGPGLIGYVQEFYDQNFVFNGALEASNTIMVAVDSQTQGHVASINQLQPLWLDDAPEPADVSLFGGDVEHAEITSIESELDKAEQASPSLKERVADAAKGLSNMIGNAIGRWF